MHRNEQCHVVSLDRRQRLVAADKRSVGRVRQVDGRCVLSVRIGNRRQAASRPTVDRWSRGRDATSNVLLCSFSWQTWHCYRNDPLSSTNADKPNKTNPTIEMIDPFPDAQTRRTAGGKFTMFYSARHLPMLVIGLVETKPVGPDERRDRWCSSIARERRTTSRVQHERCHTSELSASSVNGADCFPLSLSLSFSFSPSRTRTNATCVIVSTCFFAQSQSHDDRQAVERPRISLIVAKQLENENTMEHRID
jgi:hypothetical protein